MNNLGGTYDCVTRTPMGEQRGTFTISLAECGTRFSGLLSNELGTLEVERGTIEGDTLRWTMEMTRPMAMTLECSATVQGDQLKGKAKAGIFGAMPISGMRRG